MKSTLYTTTLKSSWSDNDGDIHDDYHNAYIRLYENGEIISRAGLDGLDLDIDSEDSYSLRGHYKIVSGVISIDLQPAKGKDEYISWIGIEMKYWGDLRENDDFLTAGKYESKYSDEGFTIKELEFKKKQPQY